jgi:hypothetical protein
MARGPFNPPKKCTTKELKMVNKYEKKIDSILKFKEGQELPTIKGVEVEFCKYNINKRTKASQKRIVNELIARYKKNWKKIKIIERFPIPDDSFLHTSSYYYELEDIQDTNDERLVIIKLSN